MADVSAFTAKPPGNVPKPAALPQRPNGYPVAMDHRQGCRTGEKDMTKSRSDPVIIHPTAVVVTVLLPRWSDDFRDGSRLTLAQFINWFAAMLGVSNYLVNVFPRYAVFARIDFGRRIGSIFALDNVRLAPTVLFHPAMRNRNQDPSFFL